MSGAGELLESWFDDRTFEFEGKKESFLANRGVLPGTLIGPTGFKAFINRDRALTSLNKKLIWASPYSDDRSPIFSVSDVDSGFCQETLDSSFRFMRNRNCHYHLEGKKEPSMQIFKTRTSKVTDKYNSDHLPIITHSQMSVSDMVVIDL